MPSLRMFLAFALLAAAPAWGAEKKTIFVFTSDASPRSDELAAVFKDNTDFAIRMSYDLGSVGDPHAFVTDNLSDLKPSLVFAVGSVALREAAADWPDVPIVYAAVAPEVAASLGRSGLFEVTSRPSADAIVDRVTRALPSTRRLALVTRTHADPDYVAKIEAACVAAGVEVHLHTAPDAEAVASVVPYALLGADALLVLDDPELWTPASLDAAFEAAAERRIPAVGFQPAQLDAPVPPALTVASDNAAVASEAARIARELLVDGKGAEAIAAGTPAPKVTANREALLDARVPLSKKSVAAVDAWSDEEAR